MNWKVIEKKYPKGFKMLTDKFHEVDDFPKYTISDCGEFLYCEFGMEFHITELFQFFDDIGFYIEVSGPVGYNSPLNKWSWNIISCENFYKHDGNLCIDRKTCWDQAFEEAFMLLEKSGI